MAAAEQPFAIHPSATPSPRCNPQIENNNNTELQGAARGCLGSTFMGTVADDGVLAGRILHGLHGLLLAHQQRRTIMRSLHMATVICFALFSLITSAHRDMPFKRITAARHGAFALRTVLIARRGAPACGCLSSDPCHSLRRLHGYRLCVSIYTPLRISAAQCMQRMSTLPPHSTVSS
jgi:hypothetical protein